MFTGLIEDIGTIQRVDSGADNTRVAVACNLDTRTLTLGESVAVDGACFTVVDFKTGAFDFEASRESLARTTLADKGAGDKVHLERAMVLGGRLGGHLVQGHVDATGLVEALRREGNAVRIEVRAPASVAALLVPKGSIAINGVSLTVNGVTDAGEGAVFDVAIIPFTGQKTLLTALEPGQRVNLEADIIGKYVQRLLGRGQRALGDLEGGLEDKGGLTLDVLRRHGYT